MITLARSRVRQLVDIAQAARILVLGDVMLDQFVWGRVVRISPEAPVPVVDFERESSMPGGASNVSRNLSALGVPTGLIGVTGNDASARQLRKLLVDQNVDCAGLARDRSRMTSIKTRIIATQQQVVRLDRETRTPVSGATLRRMLREFERRLDGADAVIIGDYGKGVVTQPVLDRVKELCRPRGTWISFDPKPVHPLDLRGLSLITPNRAEAFELAGTADGAHRLPPLEDPALLGVADALLAKLQPAILLITLGDQGMLLCRKGHPPYHIPTAAQEVFDVSGAGDTVIASFTLAIVGGASPVEAAILSNHAAGVVVGKFGTATVTPEELLASFKRS